MTTLHQYTAKFALSLPETHCSQPFGEGCDVYKVMNKVFMLSFHLEGKAVINLKVIPDNGVMLRDIYPYIHSKHDRKKKKCVWANRQKTYFRKEYPKTGYQMPFPQLYSPENSG